MKSFIAQKIKFVIAFALMAIVLPSCNDFLVEDPTDRIAISNYYKTEEDAVSAVNAIYAHLNAQSSDTFGGVYHSNFWIMVGLASDEMLNNHVGNAGADQLSNFTYSPQNDIVLDVWKQHYKAITLANIAIARVPLIDMNETLRTRLTNEAKFLRGLLYFNLVRLYGKIPLLIEEEEPLRPEVAEVEAIYTQIIQDLTDAEGLPADQSDGRGRATSGAAKAILAKVHLTRGEYAASAAKSLEVISSGKYELWEDYVDVFKIANRGGKEAIFTVGFGDANGSIIFWEGGQFHVRLLPTMLMSPGGITNNTLGWQIPTQALVDSYESGDERRGVSVFNQFNETVDGTAYNVPFDKYYFRKYWDVTDPKEFTNEQTKQDFSVIRYSDVLLMYAEALNAQNGPTTEAYDALNEVRNRAGLDDLDGLTKDEFMDAVLQERKVELAAEGHRWFDLVRTNKLETLVPVAKTGVTPASRFNLFPIPQRERDLNSNLPQNDY